MNLSKSRYTKGIQCPKMLWMDTHKPELFDESVMNQAVLETGSYVGDLAMGYYGEFVEVAFQSEGKHKMLEDTEVYYKNALSGKGPVNIAEASFAYDGNFCSVDILRVEQDGVHLVEVKSSTHINDIYYHDMAFQTWVLGKCGLNVKSASLMHLNSGYIRNGALDLHELFIPEDCTSDVFAMQDEVEENVERIKSIADQSNEPKCAIGEQCKKPYPCGYTGWCWREIPKPSIFDLNRMNAKKAFELKDGGVLTLEEVIASGTKLNKRQEAQVGSFVEGKQEIIDRGAVAQFLEGLTYPLYFLDFETFQPAVPMYDGTRPYQQIPTQYSLHVVRAPQAKLEHYEFLATAGEDPRRAVAEHLVQDIPAGEGVEGALHVEGTTIAYNMSFEKGRIKELAERFPDMSEKLLAINESMADLMVPFQQGTYYVQEMGGSNSIKAVLPALFPDDPELDYHELEGVHNGSEAMNAFENLANMDPEEAETVRAQLLKYCELDTLAMVKIWQKLVEKTEEEK